MVKLYILFSAIGFLFNYSCRSTTAETISTKQTTSITSRTTTSFSLANCNNNSLNHVGDWYYDSVRDTCYMVSRVLDTWENAEKSCNQINAHLVTITPSRSNFVTDILARSGSSANARFWIGLRLVDSVNLHHNWIDGSNSLFRQWNTNEPNPAGVQACVSINNEHGKWVDDYCLRRLRYICAVSQTAVTLPPPRSEVSDESWGCPESCVSSNRCVAFREHCYYLSSSKDLVTWTKANQNCKSLYNNTNDRSRSSFLLSVHDQMEQDFILGLLGQVKDGLNRWIGLHEDPADQTKATFFWTDDTPFDFNNWNWREPRYTNEPECVAMYNVEIAKSGRWNDAVCSIKKPYICKMKKTNESSVTPTRTVWTSTFCKPGFEAYGSACFAINVLPNGGGTWQEARNFCAQTERARIATVSDLFENAFLHVELGKKMNFTPAVNGSSAWIGMKVKAGSLSWESGYQTNFHHLSNFLDGNMPENELCVDMGYDGQWKTNNCNTQKNKYVICEVRNSEQAQKMLYANSTCPYGFPVECADYCYYIKPGAGGTAITPGNGTSWRVAKNECAKLNASLVSIRSEADQSCLTKNVEQFNDPLWIGLEEVYDTKNASYRWKWMNPEVEDTAIFTNWNTGEPTRSENLFDSHESCVEIYGTGKWNNAHCSAHAANNGYICEKKKIPITVPTSSPSSALTAEKYSEKGFGTSGNIGAIVGIVIGVVSVLVLVCTVLFVWYRRRIERLENNLFSAGRSSTDKHDSVVNFKDLEQNENF